MCCGVVDCLFYVLQDFSRDHYDFKQLQIYLYFHSFEVELCLMETIGNLEEWCLIYAIFPHHQR